MPRCWRADSRSATPPAQGRPLTDTPRGYEIWDLFAAVLIEDFDTQEEALAFVRLCIESDEEGGEDPASGLMQQWGLIEVTTDGSWGPTIAEGKALLKLAREAKP